MYAELDGNDPTAAIGTATQGSNLGRDEGSEHVVIGRLIRRLRVSESPDRFHLLAANVLRSSLGVDAVAWVPRDARDAGDRRGLGGRDGAIILPVAGPSGGRRRGHRR